MPHRRGSLPLPLHLPQRQVDQLHRRPVVREVPVRLHRPPHRADQALDRVRRVDRPADRLREREERDHLLPLPTPGPGDRRTLPALLPRLERVLLRRRPVDRLQRRAQQTPLLERGIRQRVRIRCTPQVCEPVLRGRVAGLERATGVCVAVSSIIPLASNLPPQSKQPDSEPRRLISPAPACAGRLLHGVVLTPYRRVGDKCSGVAVLADGIRPDPLPQAAARSDLR